MIIEKTSEGCVVQRFDTEKMEWISQEFISSNQSELEVVELEDDVTILLGNKTIDMMENQYLPFDMVQPNNSLLI